MGDIIQIGKRDIEVEEWKIGNYLDTLEEVFKKKSKSSLYDKRVLVKFAPDLVDTKYEKLASLMGGLLVPTKAVRIRPEDEKPLFNNFFTYGIWNGIKSEIDKHLEDIVVGEKRKFVVSAHPYSWFGPIRRRLGYYVSAYEKDGKFIQLKGSNL